MGVIAAVILAAGAGSRFDGPTHKLLSRLAGRRVIDRAVEPALNARIGPVIVVSGTVDLTLDQRDDLIVVDNPDWQRGQLSSLMVGITEAARHGAEAIAVALGDQPHLTPQAWRQVVTSPSPIGVATYGGRRGHPVYLEATTWPTPRRTSPMPQTMTDDPAAIWTDSRTQRPEPPTTPLRPRPWPPTITGPAAEPVDSTTRRSTRMALVMLATVAAASVVRQYRR